MSENQKVSKETTVTVERGDYRIKCVGDDESLTIVSLCKVSLDGIGTVAGSLSAFDVIMLGELAKEALSAVRGWRSDLEYAALGCKTHGVVLAPEAKCPVCESFKVTPPAPEQVPTPPADKPDYTVPL